MRNKKIVRVLRMSLSMWALALIVFASIVTMVWILKPEKMPGTIMTASLFAFIILGLGNIVISERSGCSLPGSWFQSFQYLGEIDGKYYFRIYVCVLSWFPLWRITKDLKGIAYSHRGYPRHIEDNPDYCNLLIPGDFYSINKEDGKNTIECDYEDWSD